MPLTSIGDLSRNLLLRQANLATKAELTTRMRELTTGLHGDIPAALGGDTRQLGRIEARLTVLKAHEQGTLEAGHRLASMQRSLDAVQLVARSLGPSLAQLGTTPSHQSLAAATVQAHQQLADVVAQLNATTGGRHLFAGTQVNTPPLPAADDLLAATRSAIGSPPSPAALVTAVNAFFDAAPGSGGFVDVVYQGSLDPQLATLAPDQTAMIDANAASPAIREVLKGMTLLALAVEAPWSDSMQAQAAILTHAGDRLMAADGGLSLLRGDIGTTEGALARAQTRNAAEAGALKLARNDLILADPYEAASAVAEAEARMEAIYSLTARLSRLSLAAYL